MFFLPSKVYNSSNEKGMHKWYLLLINIFRGLSVILNYISLLFFNFYLLILEIERNRRRKRERVSLSCRSTYWCIHWLLLVCALTRDRTCNLGVLGRHSKQLGYLTSTNLLILDQNTIPIEEIMCYRCIQKDTHVLQNLVWNGVLS